MNATPIEVSVSVRTDPSTSSGLKASRSACIKVHAGFDRLSPNGMWTEGYVVNSEKLNSPARPGTPGQPAQPEAPHEPAPVDISEESIAGEEDPGASLDVGPGGPAPSPVPKDGGPGPSPEKRP